MTAAVRAELVGDNIARTSDIMVSTGAPVLELCSRLARAGIDPATPLEAYRGDVLCLRVRSIGEGAQLVVNGEGNGFRQSRQPGTAPLVDSAGAGLSDPPPAHQIESRVPQTAAGVFRSRTLPSTAAGRQ